MFLSRLLLLTCMAATASLVQAAPAAVIPVSDFVRQDEYSQPQLSPDGKYLAITVRLPRGERDVPTIVVYALPDMKQMSAVQLKAAEYPAGYRWVSNTRLVVTIGREIGSLEAPQLTGELMAMDFDGRKQAYLYGYNMELRSRHGNRYTENRGFGFVVGIPRERNGRYLLGTHTGYPQGNNEMSTLYDAHATSADRRLIALIKHPELGFLVQHDGTPRFASGRERSRDTQVLFKRDSKDDTWRKLDKDAAEHDLVPFAFTPDDSAFLATTSGVSAPVSVVRQDMATGKTVDVAKDSVGDIVEFQFGPGHENLFAAGTLIGIPKMQFMDASAPETKLYQLLSSKFPGQYVDFLNFTDDGSKLLFEVRSDREPGAYFLYDRPSGKAYPLFARKPQIDPAQMAERRPIEFKARDGLALYGYLTLPEPVHGKKPALILLPHGGPHGPFDSWFYDRDAQFLASRGYAVLQVNFRGSGGRGLRFERAGHREWGGKIQDDLIDGVRWTIAQGLVDGSRVCSYGASFGGYSALMVTARAPDLFKCAVGYAGVYDLALMFKNRRWADNELLQNAYADYLGTESGALERNSPSKLADQIRVPVMLVHGKDDEIAIFEHAERMRAALKAAGHDPEWMAVPDEGHGFYATKNATAFYEKLEAFLAKHLK